jgi:hypothetical protein
MPLTNTDIRAIVALASSFRERVEGGYEPEQPVDEEQVENLLTRWRELIAPGDPQTFERRLAWDGIDETIARSFLAPPCLAADNPLPAWAVTLRNTVNAAEALTDHIQKTDYALDYDNPIPFEEVILPFVVYARKKLSGKDGQFLGRYASMLPRWVL